jgi:sugar fermentation stimulation protein A
MRHKRFLAQVELADGSRPWVHVPNSGALTGCMEAGGEILLTRDERPGRKTDYTWRFSRGPQGWICIDTLAPNRLIAAALADGALPGLSGPYEVHPEVPLPGGSRLDFLVIRGDRRLYMEVKSVTWVEDGIALFPDGVTSRGRRHLEHLAHLVRQGHEAWQVFVVQRQDAQVFLAAAQVDPAYAAALTTAAAAGVHILVLQEIIAPPQITLASPLPFGLT